MAIGLTRCQALLRIGEGLGIWSISDQQKAVESRVRRSLHPNQALSDRGLGASWRLEPGAGPSVWLDLCSF